MIKRTTAQHFMTLALTLLLVGACSDSPGDGVNPGEDGAPIEADGGLDGGMSAADVGATDGATEMDGEVAEDTDALSVFSSDLPVIKADQISDDVDLSEFFPDAVGPEEDIVAASICC